MTQWRYTAIPVTGGPTIRGLMPSDSAADVRASLRRAGLRILRVDPVRSARLPEWFPLRESVRRRLRTRRRHAKAELFESLATMLDAGVSLTDALETMSSDQTLVALNVPHADGTTKEETSQANGRRTVRRLPPGSRLAGRLRDAVRSGLSLADSMAAETAWFDPAEIAMARAGEHRGEIAPVLRSLAERHHRSGEVAAKLATALAYPAIVCAVGVGVVVFLSTSTLPQLVGVLREAGVAPPPLTLAVMSVGRTVVMLWPGAISGVAFASIGIATGARVVSRWGLSTPQWIHSLIPTTLRQAALAAGCLDLSELLRVGVPLTEALRIIAPSIVSPASAGLARSLTVSAERIERGESFGQTLDNPRWFDAEIVRLIGIGEGAGELHLVLKQIGEARTRRARRAVDRLAAMLEPAVIIVLSGLVGLVVMSAVLPMLRLQEVI